MVDFAGDPVTLSYEITEESESVRKLHHSQWETNKRIYGGGSGGDHWDTTANEGQNQQTVNLTRNAVHGMLSVMVETPPQTTVDPVETDTQGLYYLRQESAAKLFNTIAQARDSQEQIPVPVENVFNSLSEGHFTGDSPLLPQQFNVLADAGIITDEDTHQVNDVTVADLLKRGLEGVWNRYAIESQITNTQLATLVLGHRDVVIEYDEELQDPVIHVMGERNTWIDPNPSVVGVFNSQHYQIAQVFDINRAIRRFPQYEMQFRKHAEDPGSSQTGNGELLADVYRNVDWERDMVVLYTTWIRDQKMTSTKEVNEKGQIVETKLKKPITGMREIRVVGGQLLFDGPSRYQRDIPADRFKLMTIVDSSYSVGLPESLEDLQKTFNRVFSNIADHTKYLAQPITWGIDEVLQRVFDQNAPWSNAKNVYSVPMSLMDRDIGRDPLNVIETPSVNPSHIAFLNVLLNIFHDVSNQGDVVRGVASSKAESGRAIDSLVSQANRLLSLASKWMDRSVARLNKIMLHHMIDFMPPEKWRKYTDKYPLPLIEIMLKRAKDAEFNVKTETSGTKQQKRVDRQQKAILMRERNAYSLKSFLKDMEVDDPEGEARRIIEEQAAITQAQKQAEIEAKRVETEAEIAVEQAKTDGKLKEIELEETLESQRAIAVENLKLQAAEEKNQSKESAA